MSIVDREKRNAYKREWARRWRAHHPEESREKRRTYKKKYYATHTEHMKKKRKEKYARTRETSIVAAGQWKRENKERVKVWNAAHVEQYRERKNNTGRVWLKKHPEVWRHKNHLRYARLKNASGTHTRKQWDEKLELFGGCCAYCGRNDVPIHRDHRLPLSRGGSNDILNVVPACRSCNCQKRGLTDAEYIPWRASRAAA